MIDGVETKSELHRLSERLFGPNGMGVKNFKFDAVIGATPEGIARAVNAALDAIEGGDFEEVVMDD